MVVLSAAVTSRSGKALISRQFVEMTRIRIEGLLAAFPKLIGTDGKQHTYVETESVRYLYQPIDNLFLLLVTNRASNIVEDLETLRLLSKVVPDVVGVSNNISEDRVTEKCFDLIFAFDEVITFGGYREPITLQQIRSNLEMESHEERLHNMIKQSKVESAKDQARAAATTIKERRDSVHMEGIAGGSGMGGIGGGDGFGGDGRDRGLSGGSSYPPPAPVSDMPTVQVSAPSRPASVKGMSLMPAGGKNKSLEDALYKEDKLAPVVPKAPVASSGGAAAPVAVPAIVHPIMLALVERVSCTTTRDGTVDAFDVKGSLTLTASDDDSALCAVQMAVGASEMFNFTTHPKVNKAVYEQTGLLQLKDTTKGFPSQRPVGILKWNHSSVSEDLVPIKINCWPEEEARGQMNVSIEYSCEQSLVLHDVRIKIPLGTSNAPNIISMDGMHKHNAQAGELLWQLDMIDQSNATGSLEFTIQQKDADAFFPISVDFSSPQIFCDMDVKGVVSGAGAAIQYGLTKGLSSEEYTIV